MNIKPEEQLPIEEVDAQEEAEMKALFARTREAQDPGDHFFEAMQGDILSQLDAPVQMRGELAPARVAESATPWWRRFLAAFSQNPTLAYGGVMAAALLALVFWPLETVTPLDPSPEVAGTDALPSEDVSGTVKVLVPHELEAGELARLHALTREMPLDLLSEEDGWTGVESESQAFLGEALDELDDSDLEWWEEQYEERTL